MKFSYILVFSLSVSILLSCKNEDNNSKTKQKPLAQVDVLIAETSIFPKSIEISGTVLSNEMVELRAETSGRLVYLNIPDGECVKEGTVLAKINDAELQAQQQQLNAQLDLAQKNEQRLSSLLQIRGVNQAEYDVVVNEVSRLKAQVAIVSAQIDKTIVRAPFSGTLGLRQVSLGAYITPQMLIGTLQQIDKIKIDFSVPEPYASFVKVGGEVTVQTLESKKQYAAKISAIEPQVNTASRNIKVRAILSNASIAPGTYVKVQLNQNKTGFVVPTNAIIPDAYENKIVVVKNGKAQFKSVETGVRTPDIIELVSGVEQGDSIVVAGILNVRPNEPVVIKRVKPLSDLRK